MFDTKINQYTYIESNNSVVVDENHLYDTFNIIKNVNGTAHYFFNGFNEIKGTDEIIIITKNKKKTNNKIRLTEDK